MSIFGFRKTSMVSADSALRGRDAKMPVPARHEVLGTPLQGPYPEGTEVAEFAIVVVSDKKVEAFSFFISGGDREAWPFGVWARHGGFVANFFDEAIETFT